MGPQTRLSSLIKTFWLVSHYSVLCSLLLWCQLRRRSVPFCQVTVQFRATDSSQELLPTAVLYQSNLLRSRLRSTVPRFIQIRNRRSRGQVEVHGERPIVSQFPDLLEHLAARRATLLALDQQLYIGAEPVERRILMAP